MIAGVLTGLILLAASVLELSSVIDTIQDMTERTGFSLYSTVILKSLDIGILAQTTADVCQDNGEAALASKVEFAAKIIILLLALPILKALLELIADFLAG